MKVNDCKEIMGQICDEYALDFQNFFQDVEKDMRNQLSKVDASVQVLVIQNIFLNACAGMAANVLSSLSHQEIMETLVVHMDQIMRNLNALKGEPNDEEECR